MPQSLTRQAALAVLAASFLSPSQAAAETVIYQFTGSVISVSNPPYDLPFAADQPVLGKFVYDTSTEGTPVTSGNDGYDYRQHFANGFTARIGPAVIATDEYLVTVVNDLTQPSGNPADSISIRYTSSFTPPLDSLHVSGMSKSGVFQLNLLGTPTIFDEPSLPPSINLGDFYPYDKSSPFTLGFLSETPFRMAVFSILSLQRIDELPGDFDRDGDVDGADLLVLQRAEGSSQPLPNGVTEPTIGAANFQLWSDNFRSTLHTQSAAPVPEPATLLIAATVTLFIRSRRQLSQLIP